MVWKQKSFTEEDINRILNLKGLLGDLIDVFDLCSVLFIGTSQNMAEWEMKNTLYEENKLLISLEDFKGCKNEVDVKQAFHATLKLQVLKEPREVN